MKPVNLHQIVECVNFLPNGTVNRICCRTKNIQRHTSVPLEHQRFSSFSFQYQFHSFDAHMQFNKRTESRFKFKKFFVRCTTTRVNSMREFMQNVSIGWLNR